MRKQLLTSLSLTAVALTAMANPIDVNTAQQLAKKYIASPIGVKSERACMKARGVKTNAQAQQAYYLFNNENGKGFAIIAADDRLGHKGVIGYSATGSLQADSLMPSALQSLLADYAAAVQAIPYDSISLPPTYNQPIKAKVDPLLPCEWNQDAPYNMYTPIKSSKQCPIGCVAAAMSQVMYFHKWPKERPEGIREVTRKGNASDLDYYDWDAMLPTYSRYTDYQASAVATLTRDVGQAVNMTYGPEGSWSDEAKEWYAFENTFGYSVRYLEKDVMPVGEYLQTIYHELSEGNPVSIVGGDHAFVYDGYDENGLVHCNWGWGGQQDGFYDINTVSLSGNPYTKGKFYYQQRALLVRPKDGKHTLFSEQPIVVTITDNQGLTVKESSCALKDGSLTAEIAEVAAHNLVQGEDYSYTGELGIGLFDAQGKCLHIFMSPYDLMEFANYYNNYHLNSTNNPWKLNFSDVANIMTDGRYYLRPMCHRRLSYDKSTGAAEWESWRLMYNANTLWLTLKDGVVTPDAAPKHAEIALAECPEVMVPPVVYAGDLAAISLKVKNSTCLDARAQLKVRFKGKGSLEGEVYDVPSGQLNKLYLAQRNTTSNWIVSFGSSYVTSTESGAMKAGKYSMEVEATYPEGDDYFEDEISGYATTTLTWPDFEVEVYPSSGKGNIIVTGLTVYTDGAESTSKIFSPNDVKQIGFGIQTRISSMRDNWLDTSVRYRIKDVDRGTWAYTSDPVSVRMPFGPADLRSQTRVNLPLSTLSANHTYEVHVEVNRDDAWIDLWNSTVPRREFSITTTNPVAGSKNVVGGFASADYAAIEQAYNVFATNPSAENLSSLSQAIDKAPRISAGPLQSYRLRCRYADNGTLYLTADGQRLIGQSLGAADEANQTFCLVPGLTQDTWRLLCLGNQKYIGAMPEAGKELVLVDDVAQAADFQLNTSLSTYATSLTAVQSPAADYATLRLGKRNAVQAWASGSESAQWYVEPTGVEASHYAFAFGQSNYITAYLPHAYQMPQGMTGYMVQSASDGIAITPAYTEGNMVPALTPLLIKSTEGSIAAVDLQSDVTTAVAAPAENLLHGSLTDALTEADGDCLFYKLSHGPEPASPLGFYWAAEEGAAFTNAALRAYLAMPRVQASQRQYFSIAPGEVTGINTLPIQPAQASPIYYDIQGRRVERMPSHGIVITSDGKKLVR